MKNKIIIALFLLVTPLLYGGYYLTYDMWDHTNYENRSFTTAEDIREASYTEKSSTVDDFVNDTVPFKNELTALNAGINLKVFGTVQSDKVLLGKDGWLFHKNTFDSVSIDDYQGLGHYTQQELEDITRKLAHLDSVLESEGIQLKIIIPPSKEQVYSQYMPDSIPVADISAAQQLADYVNANSDVEFIYPLKELKAAAETENVYYKYDTHWNNLGALYGVQLLLDDYHDATAVLTEGEVLTDLADVSGVYPYIGEDDYYEVTANVEMSGQVMQLLHDSFGDAMIPLLEEKYEVKARNCSLFGLFAFDEEADIFVIEMTERYRFRLFNIIDELIRQAEEL